MSRADAHIPKGVGKKPPMAKKVLINVEEREVRIAILEDGQLVELYIESLDNKTILNNIYRGKVEGIVAGLNAAFVNIGFERNAFLHFSDIRSNLLLTPESKVELEAYEAKCAEIEQKLELIEDADDELEDNETSHQNNEESQQFGRHNNWRNRRDRRNRHDRGDNRKGKNSEGQNNQSADKDARQGEATNEAAPEATAANDKPSKDRKRQRRDRRKHNKNRNDNAVNQMNDEPFAVTDPELLGTRAAVNPFDVYMPYGKDNNHSGRNGNRRNRGAKVVQNENEWVAPAENDNLPNDGRDSQQDFFGNVDLPTDNPMSYDPEGLNEESMDNNNKKKSKNRNKRRYNKSFRRRGGSNFAVRKKAELDTSVEAESVTEAAPKAKKSTTKKATTTAQMEKKTKKATEAKVEKTPVPEKKKAVSRKTKAAVEQEALPGMEAKDESEKKTATKKKTTTKAAATKTTTRKKAAEKKADEVKSEVTDSVAVVKETKAVAKKADSKKTTTKRKTTKAVKEETEATELVAVDAAPKKKTTRVSTKKKVKDKAIPAVEPEAVEAQPVAEAVVETMVEQSSVAPEQLPEEKPAKKTTSRKSAKPATAGKKASSEAKKAKQPALPENLKPSDIAISIDDVKPAEGNGVFVAELTKTPAEADKTTDIRSSENASISIFDVIGGKPTFPPKPKLHYLPVTQALQKGDEILVQVTKEEIGVKGARITSFVSLPGRYLVLMPNSEDEDAGGVSRKVNDFQERKRLKKVLRSIRRDIGDRSVGVIVRTAGIDREEAEIRGDADFLCTQWREIQQVYSQSKAPTLVYDDSDILHRLARDVFDDSITEIEIDDPDEGENLKAILKRLIPSLVEKVRIYDKPLNIFHHYGVEKQIQKAGRRKVWLKSGGYLIIDEAEALTAIDVNSGKFVGKDDQEKMILKTNLEAARAIARELRLRDIGGIIVCDFIDMKEMHNRETLLNEFRNILRKDRARTNVSGISEFGLVEMTRKRVRRSLRRTIFSDCPYCQGAGVVLNDAQIWLHIKHDIIGILNSPQCSETLEVLVNPRIKDYIDCNCRETLEEWKEEFGTEVIISKNDMLHIEHYAIDIDSEEVVQEDSSAEDNSEE